MEAYNIYNPSAQGAQSAAETLVFLRPEQIRCKSTRAQRKKGAAEARSGRNALIRLAESIKRYGILEPLAVRLVSDSAGYPYYELLEGERRYRAACIAGLAKLPCRVLRADDKQCAEWAVFENLEQNELNFFEKAEAFAHLMRDFHLTQEEIARKLSLSQSAVANKLRLLRLTKAERDCILQHGLSERHARALIRLTDEGQRLALLREITAHHLNVAQTEARIEAFLAPKPETEPTETVRAPSGALPQKFALQDLRPLYNSIDRTLAIFRKTGMAAECRHEERENGVEITIHIPK
ncbi:MAG: ParB/RepB/Spo0J family partition protein [Clostridia bacterium]|nr:ParB/RepB/Spo0J family partition protein [Clostridia bacterium]